MTDSPDFLYEKQGHVGVLTWNRPEKRNCFTPQMMDDYYAALDDFNHDPDLWVAVLASTGDQAWCSGSTRISSSPSSAR
jgi:enoyl-CoA hydratase/carnithine racemase